MAKLDYGAEMATIWRVKVPCVQLCFLSKVHVILLPILLAILRAIGI